MTHHPGNVMFQSLIESRLEDHTNTSQDGKHVIEFDIIRYVRRVKRGRFLTWDNAKCWWANMLTDDDCYGDDDDDTGRHCEQETEAATAVFGKPIHFCEEETAASIPTIAIAYAAATNKKEMQEIRGKVHYAFRDFIKKQKTQQHLQVLRSSTYLFERQQHEVMHYKKRTRRSNYIGDGGGGSSDESTCANNGCGAWALCDTDSDGGIYNNAARNESIWPFA